MGMPVSENSLAASGASEKGELILPRLPRVACQLGWVGIPSLMAGIAGWGDRPRNQREREMREGDGEEKLEFHCLVVFGLRLRGRPPAPTVLTPSPFDPTPFFVTTQAL